MNTEPSSIHWKDLYDEQSAALERLVDICETAKLTEKERERYEESIKVYRDNLSIIDAAVQEGEAKGLVKGEAKKQAEIALNLKAMGMELSNISKATGLSEEEISKL